MVNPGIILGPGQWGKGSSQLFMKAWQGLKFYPFGGTGMGWATSTIAVRPVERR